VLTARSSVAALLPVVLWAGTAAAGSTDEPESLPYAVAVQVVYGEPRGPDSLRDEIRRRVVHDLSSRGWFEDVAAFVEGETQTQTAELLLHVTLDELRRETRYATSMAARQEQDDPLSRQQFTVEFSVNVTVDLFLMPEGVAVRSGRFREATSRPPRYPGEDAEAAIRDEALDNLARSIRKAAFKGSLDKLGQAIEREREQPSSPSSSSR